MSKKNFKEGFDLFLGNSDKEKKTIIKEKEIRATFIVSARKIEMMKYISFWERKKIKKVVDEAFTNYIESYISKNGEIKIPEEIK